MSITIKHPITGADVEVPAAIVDAVKNARAIKIGNREIKLDTAIEIKAAQLELQRHRSARKPIH